MLAIVVVAALALAPPFQCNSSYYATCQLYGSTTLTALTYNEYVALNDPGAACTFCNSVENCTAQQPGSNIVCYPYAKSCSMCGTLSSAAGIGPDYSLIIQRRCTSNAPCPDAPVVTVNSTVTLTGSTALTIRGQETPTTRIVAACPLFVFEGATSVSISGLEIDCTTSGKFISAILFQNTDRLRLIVADLYVSGAVHSALTVIGGDRSQVPPSTSVDLGGSAIGDVRITNTTYRQTADVTLGLYYGVVNVSEMPDYSTIVIQPSVDPRTGTADGFAPTSTPLVVLNASGYTNDVGSDYEIQVEQKGAFSFQVDPAAQNAHILGPIAIVLALAIPLQHSDTLYLMRLRR